MSNNTNTLFWIITGSVIVLSVFILTNKTFDGTIKNVDNEFEGYAKNIIHNPKMQKYYGHVNNYNNLIITDESLFDFDVETQTITGYNGGEDNIVFPYQINGVEVKKIADLNLHNLSIMSERCEKYVELLKERPDNEWLKNQISILEDEKILVNGVCQERKKLKRIVLPNTITSVGPHSFLGNDELTDVVFPASIEKIETQAFEGCNIKNIDFKKMPKLYHIGTYAFSNNSITGTIEIPSTITELSYSIFSDNDIRHVIFNANLDFIPAYTFQNNKNLVDVILKRSNYNISSKSNNIDTVFNRDSSLIVYVPIGSKNWYKTLNALEDYQIIEKEL